MATGFGDLVTIEMHGLDGVLDMLHNLPAEISGKKGGGPVAAALRKAAKVIQKQELANLQAVTANAKDPEKRTSTGFLAKNVVVSRGKKPIGSKGERYLVRVRRKGYPGRSTGSGKKLAGVSTLKTGQLLEYGAPGNNQPAEPWIRPAVISRGQEAIATFEREIRPQIERAAKRLTSQASGRGRGRPKGT